jgi:hypothetical protein
MKIHELGNTEEMADALMQLLEEETGQKIFTLRITGERDTSLEALIVFEDKSILMGLITVQDHKGKWACRVRGNFI